MLKAFAIYSLSLLLLSSTALFAKDLGTFGTTFPILEENLIEIIKRKILKLSESRELEKHQNNILQRMLKHIERPISSRDVAKTKLVRTFLYDPTIIVPQDLKDHRNVIFHKAGTSVNPLDIYSLKRPLLVINGDDEIQVNWALAQHKLNPKIILVRGAPFELMKKHNIQIYFDQGGTLVKKFGIQQVPARVTQSGKFLKIEEVLPEGENK